MRRANVAWMSYGLQLAVAALWWLARPGRWSQVQNLAAASYLDQFASAGLEIQLLRAIKSALQPLAIPVSRSTTLCHDCRTMVYPGIADYVLPVAPLVLRH